MEPIKVIEACPDCGNRTLTADPRLALTALTDDPSAYAASPAWEVSCRLDGCGYRAEARPHDAQRLEHKGPRPGLQ